MENLIDLHSGQIDVAIKILLKDRTTGQNIIFATDTYENIYFTSEITLDALDRIDIKPRVLKRKQEQANRTKKKAEVFTPSWLCNKMNNYCDSDWFGRDDVFNNPRQPSQEQEKQVSNKFTEQDCEWIPTTGKIEFPEGKTWKDYIYNTRLEITCGEAPFLVSRYDTTTGEILPIDKRIGILDRKMRVINENTETRKAWIQWVYRAFESVYGYEYQGDNLLIARINLFNTFCDYALARWESLPTDSELKRIANIISWNIWQMDGLKGVVPYTDTPEEAGQLSLFNTAPQLVDCKIYDWRCGECVEFKNIRN